MNQWVQQRGGYPNPVNPLLSLQTEVLPLQLCSPFPGCRGMEEEHPIPSGQPQTSWVLNPTLEPHVPGYSILTECPFCLAAPFPPAIPSHANILCFGHLLPLTFPSLKRIPFCCLCLFPGTGLSPLPVFVTGYQYSCCRQHSFTHGMSALEQPVRLQRVFISEGGFSVLTAAISSILIGISKLPTAHTNLSASALAAGLTTQLQSLKIMPCAARNNPTILWRVKFYQHCGSGLWQITQQSPVNLGQSHTHK